MDEKCFLDKEHYFATLVKFRFYKASTIFNSNKLTSN